MIQARRNTVLLSGICALVLSLGLARYSFTPMIPQMQDQLEFSAGLAGWLAGWNYVGYLVGLFIVWLVTDLRAKDFFYRYGLIVAVLATAMMAADDHRLVWYVSRFFAGIACAAGFMFGTGLILNWLNQNNHKSELGLHFSGIGLGIVLSALVVEVTAGFDLGWRQQWLALAGVGVGLAILAIGLLPMPGEHELERARNRDIGRGYVEKPPLRWLWLVQIAYFCAGFSNTLNVTFTSLITELQPLAGWGTRMWLLVGLAAAPAPWIWDRIARRVGRMDALKAAFALNIVGNICVAFTFSIYVTALAAVLFGFTFMGVVSLTLSTVGRAYGYEATQIMARLTFGYCLAQIISPIFSGALAEMTGSFRIPLLLVCGVMIGGLVCLTLAGRLYRVQRFDERTAVTAT